MDKTYGTIKDGTPLTDASAKKVVDSAFAALKSGKGKVLKSPVTGVRIRASVSDLPEELQKAALYK